ncbi:hypothetical protein SAMN02910292_00822 [Lachnospiraceae bacterium XBB2008]|nr:hypothetical protein SAMN02910292_00822 [Lachnospiraceae bacterium XBB2008]
MNLKKSLNNDKMPVILTGILSALIFAGIYGIKILDPLYTSWLLNGGDLTQHYLGWLAYRESAWRFPIGMVDTLAYPNLTSVIFTDSIPICAVICKLLSPILPFDLQYFGIWGITCFILQGTLTANILRRYTSNSAAVILCSALSVLTPVMILRMYMHTSLGGQWILIYCLGLLIGRDRYADNKKIYLHIALIGLLSAGIHMYFVLMCGIIIAGICLIDILENKRIIRSLCILADYVLIAGFVTWSLGGFDSGMSSKDIGLGFFSFNLNGFYDPQGWSCIIPDRPLAGDGQWEGFAYLGAGLGLLLAVAILSVIIDREPLKDLKTHWKTVVALAAVFAVSLFIALSPVITLSDRILFVIPVSDRISDIWSVFRASGRIIWPCCYILELCIFIVLIKYMRKAKILIPLLAMALMLQIYDIHVPLADRYSSFGKEAVFDTPLDTEEFWTGIAENEKIKHVVYYEMPDQTYMYPLTYWALANDKTVNNFYFARSIQDKVNKCRNAALSELPEDSIFIFPENTDTDALGYDLNYYHADHLIIGYVHSVISY